MKIMKWKYKIKKERKNDVMNNDVEFSLRMFRLR